MEDRNIGKDDLSIKAQLMGLQNINTELPERISILGNLNLRNDRNELLRQIQETNFIHYLLQWNISEECDEHNDFQIVKWRFITFAIQTYGEKIIYELCSGTIENWKILFTSIAKDRFACQDVLIAMTTCIFCIINTLLDGKQDTELNHWEQTRQSLWEVLKLSIDETDDQFTGLDLLKQLYVTVHHEHIRRQFICSLQYIIISKQHAKDIVRSGFVRSVLQIALERIEMKQSDDIECTRDAVFLLERIVPNVCYLTIADQKESYYSISNESITLPSLVVNLLLSSVRLVTIEGIKLLQMLLQTSFYNPLCLQVPDLKGALEQMELKLTKESPSNVYALTKGEMMEIRQSIDDLERKNGVNFIGLSDTFDLLNVKAIQSVDETIIPVIKCKKMGYSFFQRGNYATARLFYRRAITMIKSRLLLEQHMIAKLLTPSMFQEKCTQIGASVQVYVHGQWRNGMIADVNDENTQVQALLDDSEDVEDDEPWVNISMEVLRLRMDTKRLHAFLDQLKICILNLGKAYSRMGEHELAVKSFTYVLSIDPNHIRGLYLRGISYMAMQQTVQAQKDLYRSNTLCRSLIKASATTNDDAKIDNQALLSLQDQISVAYRRLKVVHKHKKIKDRKLIKEMMKYISGVTGIQ